jgi:hypothetical protein
MEAQLGERNTEQREEGRAWCLCMLCCRRLGRSTRCACCLAPGVVVRPKPCTPRWAMQCAKRAGYAGPRAAIGQQHTQAVDNEGLLRAEWPEECQARAMRCNEHSKSVGIPPRSNNKRYAVMRLSSQRPANQTSHRASAGVPAGL